MNAKIEVAMVALTALFVFGCERTENVKDAVPIHAGNVETVSALKDDVTAATLARITSASVTPSGEITENWSYGWIAGTMNWFIPVGWNETGSSETDTPVKEFCVYWQRFRMASDGTLEVEKLENIVQRKTNTIVRLNGKIVPLRPR